jgi:hypothetical protein
MKRNFFKDLCPLFSLTIILATLFTLVFLQMEERRYGYSLLKLNRDLKKIIAEKRIRTAHLAQSMRLQTIEQIAHANNSLDRPVDHQVIHLTAK